MKISAEIYLSPFVDCDENREDSVCSAVWNGILEAEQKRVADGAIDQAFVSLHSVEFIPNGDAEKLLEIKYSPTLIFFDETRQIALTKLTKSQINKTAVKNAYLYLASLEPTSTDGSYVDAGGKEIGQDDLFDMFGSGKWGLGLGLGLGPALGGCPKWMPKGICDFPFWIFTFILVLIVILILLKLRK